MPRSPVLNKSPCSIGPQHKTQMIERPEPVLAVTLSNERRMSIKRLTLRADVALLACLNARSRSALRGSPAPLALITRPSRTRPNPRAMHLFHHREHPPLRPSALLCQYI